MLKDSELKEQIANALKKKQEEASLKTSPDDGESMIEGLADVIGTAIATYVRSATIRPDMFQIKPSSVITVGSAATQAGPTSLVPLAPSVGGELTLGDLQLSAGKFPPGFPSKYPEPGGSEPELPPGEEPPLPPGKEPDKPPVKKPEVPILISPVDNFSNAKIDTFLSWAKLDNVLSYRIQVSTDISFNSLWIDEATAGLGIDTGPVHMLEYSTQYFWRVRGANSKFAGEWSNVWSFTTAAEPVVVKPPKKP